MLLLPKPDSRGEEEALPLHGRSFEELWPCLHTLYHFGNYIHSIMWKNFWPLKPESFGYNVDRDTEPLKEIDPTPDLINPSLTLGLRVYSLNKLSTIFLCKKKKNNKIKWSGSQPHFSCRLEETLRWFYFTSLTREAHPQIPVMVETLWEARNKRTHQLVSIHVVWQ